MPSDSVLQFLERARSVPLLPPDQTVRLPKPSPDEPDLDLPAFCDRLAADGVLTPFQAERIRAGRGEELAVGPYALTNELDGPPGGRTYAARHAVSGEAAVLVSLAGGPAGERLQAIASLEHPHLALGGVLIEGPGGWWLLRRGGAGADLARLVDDIGPMPYPLAANYARQVAQALAVAHGRGLVHGGVRPGCWYVPALVPLPKPRPDGTPRYRPAPSASVQLEGWEATPPPEPLADRPADAPAGDALFLPPERVASGATTAAGDIYGLGATLFYLLAARPPVVAATNAELTARLRDGAPPHLALIRPDIPAELVAAVEEMLRRDPERRPTARAMVERLAALGREPAKAPQPIPSESDLPLLDLGEVADGAPRSAIVQPDSWIAAVPMEREPVPDPAPAPPAYPPPVADYAPPPLEAVSDAEIEVPARRAAGGGQSWKIWLAVGLALNVIGVVGWVYLFGGFNSAPAEPPPAKKKAPAKAVKRAPPPAGEGP